MKLEKVLRGLSEVGQLEVKMKIVKPAEGDEGVEIHVIDKDGIEQVWCVSSSPVFGVMEAVIPARSTSCQ